MNLATVLEELRELMDEAASSGGVGDALGQDTIVDWPVSGAPGGSRTATVDGLPAGAPTSGETAPSEDSDGGAVEVTAELPDASMGRSPSRSREPGAGDDDGECPPP